MAYKNPATTCTAGTCMSGNYGFDGTTNTIDAAYGTYTYVDFKNMAGTSSVGFKAQINTQNLTLRGITMNNAPGIAIRDCSATGSCTTASTGNLTINGIQVTNSNRATGSVACLSITSPTSSASGIYSVQNVVLDCPIGTGTAGSHFIDYKNIFLSAGNGGSFPGQYPGWPTNVTDGGLHDSVFLFHNGYNSGSAYSNSVRTNIPVKMINSVFWSELTLLVGDHDQAFQGFPNSTDGTGYMLNEHNFTGGMVNAGSPGVVTSFTSGADMPILTTVDSRNNVTACGYDGWGSSQVQFMRINGPTHPLCVGGTQSCTQERLHNMVICNNNSMSPGLASHTSVNGAAGGESPSGIAPNTVQSDDSNIRFHSTTTKGSGPVIAAIGPTVYTSWITYYGKNVDLNTNNTANPPISTCCTSWFVTIEQDIVRTNPVVPFVDQMRTVPWFMDYLDASGLLTKASLGASAWQTGIFYPAGAYVTQHDPSAWSDKVTYWYCIQSHTSSSLNAPVIGNDASNRWIGSNPYWVPAFIPWLKRQVYNGTTYNDGAVDCVGCTAIGLLNRWLLAGYYVLDPTLWTGCKVDATYNPLGECGLQVPSTRRIPPPMAMN